MSFALHCRVWDAQNQTMHYLSSLLAQTEDFQVVLLEDAMVLINTFNSTQKRLYEAGTPWRLMLSVGQPDRDGTPIYDYDIVDSEGYLWVVQNHPDRCGYSLFMPNCLGLPPYLILDRIMASEVKVMGNFFEDPHLILDFPDSSYRQAA